jgi:rubrerythrin
MVMFLSFLLGAVVLIAYSMFEKRINQRPCLECGYGVSVDATNEQCPRCGALVNEIADE